MKPNRGRGREEQGEVLRYGRDGDALVRLSTSGDAWARNVVPGDVGRFVARKSGKRLDADLVALERPSDERVAAACSIADRCGGCPWMIARTSFAHDEKRAAVARAIRTDDVTVAFVASSSEVGYRRRTRLAYDARRSCVVGYRPARSDAVIDVTRCEVLVPSLAEALGEVRARIAPGLAGQGELRLALGAQGRAVLAIRTPDAQSSAVYESLRASVVAGAFCGAALFVGGANRPAIFGDPVERTPALDGSSLEGTVDGFSQANDAVALAMARAVFDLAGADGARVLELYAGHGHLGVALAAVASRFVAVEQSAEAAEAFRRNLTARALTGRVLAADAADAPRDPCDVVVLDPPRTGALEAIPLVLAVAPRTIVMASCDPRTLERDLRRLSEAGYRVTDAIAFDMFPGTPHVESVVRLERVG